MNVQHHSKKESKLFEPCTHPPTTNKVLDVRGMTKPIIENYDAHVSLFINFLSKKLVSACLVYEGPADVSNHIVERTTYACSVRKGNRLLRDVFPVMIGSKLDSAIRHGKTKQFSSNKFTIPSNVPFEKLDIALGFFLISGFVRHLPFSFTNDPTNTHVFGWTTARVFSYDSNDRGKQLTWYSERAGDIDAGEIRIVYNNGSVSSDERDISDFFHHCPYPVTHEPYVSGLVLNGKFDIDDLGNKIVVTPGHLFVKLFIKYLYVPLKDGITSKIKSNYNLVIKSIETGNLLHVLSRKTVYFKEMASAGKMTEAPTAHREIGDNGVVYKEKTMGCYREVNTQTYPLNPYLLQLIVRQTSSKVKRSSLTAYHPSYQGFLCPIGCFDTKDIGRSTFLVKNIEISVCESLNPVFSNRCKLWKELDLIARDDGRHFVIVNEACVSVTEKCFLKINLLRLKQKFGKIECFQTTDKQKRRFILIRYKTGLMFKKLTRDVWITPRDELFWSNKLFELDTKQDLVAKFGYDYYTSYLVDLNPFFMHNAAPKNILGFNSLKNSVLATDDTYARYFMDSLTAFRNQPCQDVVLPPVDEFSQHFVLCIPRVVVAYMSFNGLTQEDCIVKGKECSVFDCTRFYTIRIRLNCEGECTFHPVKGDIDPEDKLLGTIVNHGNGQLMVEEPSQNISVKNISAKEKMVYFKKTPFRIVQYMICSTLLTVCIARPHPLQTGDKLCSLHGQKGVLRIVDGNLPLLDESVRPDIIVNCYCMFRMTPGQIIEGIVRGGGRDANKIRNSDGHLVPGAVFYAKTLYYPIAYWSVEHMYAPTECVRDKILNQAVKGRSRGGGMKLGNMEIYNGLRANGLAFSCEEKIFENGDIINPNYVPKSVELVTEDAKFFKANLRYHMRPSVVSLDEPEIKRRRTS